MADLSDKPFSYRMKKEGVAYIYLLPMLVVIAFLNFYPIGYTFYISLTKAGPFNYSYVGLANYLKILLSTDSSITLQILSNSFFWATASIAIFIPLGLGLASVFNQELRGKTIYRTLILLPWAMPAYITILTWSNMLNYEYGIVNTMLGLVHIPAVNWTLGTPVQVWSGLLMVNTWLSFPFYTIVFLAAIQAIPSDLYESATIDGASTFYKFRRITVPFIWPTIAFVGLMGWLFTFNNFYPIYFITSGGPGYSTYIFVVYAYQEAFSYYQYQFAAAYSVIDFLVLLVIAMIAIKYTKLTEGWLK